MGNDDEIDVMYVKVDVKVIRTMVRVSIAEAGIIDLDSFQIRNQGK